MSNDLVSIIMLSRNKGRYVAESVRSVIAQTYQNWELIFMDDSSKDDTISQMMDLMDEAKVMVPSTISTGSAAVTGSMSRIRVSQNVGAKGSALAMNSALRDARGRWIAFLNVGDLWEPTKLERQIAFMEENGYACSYTCYGVMDAASNDRGVVVSGKARVNHQDMLKCCWPAYLTVMYDAEKVGRMSVRTRQHNDYALWLNISDKHDFYLLPERLASLRTNWNLLGRFLLTNNTRWRYDAYHIDENLGKFKSFLYTFRNGWFGLVKWFKYVNRT
jgi:glycosyltransferase involved in cell wall biosynthesis